LKLFPEIESKETKSTINQSIEFSNLKEYKKKCDDKLEELQKAIELYEKYLATGNDEKMKNEEKLNGILMKENEIFKEIQAYQNNLTTKLNNFESQRNMANNLRKELMDKIKIETEKYSALLKVTLLSMESRYNNELQNIKNEYNKDIKSLHIDLMNLDKEDVGKRELLKNLSDLSKIRKNSKKREINLIKDKLSSEHLKLVQQYELIKNLNSEYLKVSNDYKQIKMEEYNLLNIFFSFDKVIEIYNHKKKEAIEKSENDYKLQFNEAVINKIEPYFGKKIIENNLEDVSNMTKELLQEENLLLKDNRTFISNYYQSKNSEILMLIKYLMIKSSSSNTTNTQFIKSNLQTLYRYSQMFDDQYTKKLIEQTNLLENSDIIPSKSDLIQQFDDIKIDLVFDFFAGDFSKMNKDKLYTSFILFNFSLAYLMSRTINFWFKVFNPKYCSINESDNIIVKKVKAINMIDFYLKHDNFSEAFACMQFLKIDHKDKIQSLFNNLYLITKCEILIDLLENHFTMDKI